ncbi:MAG: hypothetical protein AAF975_00545 [Spirochaetota bacterium]
MKFCLIVLTVCFLSLLWLGCLSPVSNTHAQAGTQTVDPPLPTEPQLLAVRFEDREGGLYLSHDNYRKLEKNIVRLRSYAEELKAQIEYYRRLLRTKQ